MHLFDRKPGQVLQIGAFAREDADLRAGLDQRTRHGPADKPGCSGHESIHGYTLVRREA